MNARRVTRLVLLVEQELFTIPDYLSSTPVFIGVRVFRSLAFCVVIVVCPFVLFLGSVLLRLTDSNYPFGIFKIF
jgi:hypothetical protein